MNEIRSLREQIKNKQTNDNNRQCTKYENWIREQSNKIAPGFNYTVMQPQKSMRNQERKLATKKEEEEEEEESDDNNDNDNGSGYDEMNELDRIFGTTKLN